MDDAARTAPALSRRQMLSLGAGMAATSLSPAWAATPAVGVPEGNPFPRDFVWGTAMSALQVEGAKKEDGRGPDVWDMFCKKPGAIWGGHTNEVSCDHYHRYREDVALMKELGLPTYRLSVDWARVFPEGTGKVNAKGLDFYDRLIDLLLRAGVQPWVMLFHWEYPLALYHRGGWMNRDSADWFADYAKVVVARLSDRVRTFMTIEEPQVFVGMGLYTGEQAPGEKRLFADYLQAAHHALLAHGKGVQAIRAHARKPVQVGFAPASSSWSPATESKADIEAARKRTFDMLPETHMHNAWWMDPPLLGHYPEAQVERMRAIMPRMGANDLKTIAQPIDFLGINVYNCRPVRAIDKPPYWEQVLPIPIAHPLTASGGLMAPQGLYWAPRYFWERYKTPLMITENGTAVADWVALDGKVHDPQRIDYINRYLINLARAMKEGVKVIGYHLWSFLDNFELNSGYKDRFGLVYVDYETQRRIPKDSAYWYREVIQSQGRSLWKHQGA